MCVVHLNIIIVNWTSSGQIRKMVQDTSELYVYPYNEKMSLFKTTYVESLKKLCDLYGWKALL